MHTTANFDDSDVHLTLSQAMLIYAGPRDFCAATVHPVKDGVIQPGRAVGRHDVDLLTGNLRRQAASALKCGHYLPPQVLASTADLLVWWAPARAERIWFSPSDKHKEEAPALAKLSGEKVLHPPLVFRTQGEHLDVFALMANIRPEPDTPLMMAPYWNLGNAGDLCLGGTRTPGNTDPARTAEWEKGFFESNFSHNNYHGVWTHCPGGHTALWQAMLAGRRPPAPAVIARRHARWLVPSLSAKKRPLTLRDVI